MKNSRRIPVGIAAVVTAAVIGFFLLGRNDPPRTESTTRTAPVVQPKSVAESTGRSEVVAPKSWFKADRPAVTPVTPTKAPAHVERSHLADALNAPNQSGMEDLKVVMNLFDQYRKRFRGFPVAEDNAGFVNALTGQNPSRDALIPRDHPAIDAKGQLLDRWGKPFFFHLLGRDALEVRSAGPDQKLYTVDDLLNASAPNQGTGLAIKEL